MSSFTLPGLFLLVVALFTANVAFLSERLFLVLRLSGGKPGWLRFLELLAWYGLTLLVAVGVETRFGPRYPQGWEFYGITACLFVVLAYPGFVWRYLRRGSLKRREPEQGEHS